VAKETKVGKKKSLFFNTFFPFATLSTIASGDYEARFRA